MCSLKNPTKVLKKQMNILLKLVETKCSAVAMATKGISCIRTFLTEYIMQSALQGYGFSKFALS